MVRARTLTRALAAGSFALSLFAMGAAGCDSGGGVREWSAKDHDNNAGPASNQASGSAAPGQDDAALVDVTWRQTCSSCHGFTGRGDTPQGRMLRVPDLTRSELASASDDDLATVIRRGRNHMPPFGQLPPKVIDGLVAKIRSLGGEAKQ